jgi:hypothetical protein
MLFLAALVIFISTFFIFFTFDSMLRSKIVCSYGEKFICNITEFNMRIVIGILIVGMFLFLDVMVVYVMLKTWVPDLFIYG